MSEGQGLAGVEAPFKGAEEEGAEEEPSNEVRGEHPCSSLTSARGVIGGAGCIPAHNAQASPEH